MNRPKKAELSTEAYICRAFGKDCRTALAISHAENGTRQCDRINVNSNKTVDTGIFMLNSVHFKKGYTMNDFTDCHKNIDIALALYKQQGWTPWVVYNTGAYKKFMQ